MTASSNTLFLRKDVVNGSTRNSIAIVIIINQEIRILGCNELVICNDCQRVIVWIMFSLHYLFILDTCIAISYIYDGYELCTYACMHMYLHVAMRMQGTASFESVITTASFNSVFWMDTVEGVHVCACM